MEKDAANRASNALHSVQSCKPYVDFYNHHGIIPVTQDIHDDNFLFRRDYLYRTLGIPLRFLKECSILEFGPGGGYNAIATSSFSPRRYVFVDGAEASLSELESKVRAGQIRAESIEIVESDIMKFMSKERFDIVIIEGVLSAQTDPASMLAHAGSFVSEGGLLILTTTTSSSLLSEVCRRVMRPRIMSASDDFGDRVNFGVEIFGSHLSTLGTKTRPVRDWVLDNIIQPYVPNAQLAFSFLNALDATSGLFDFYSSSPRFLVDDRFYKAVRRGEQSVGDLVREQYHSLYVGCLDFRVHYVQLPDFSIYNELNLLCDQALNIQAEIVLSGTYDLLEEFLVTLKAIEKILPNSFSATKRSIKDYVRSIPAFCDGRDDVSFGEFERWWGRGQQYMSLYRTSSLVR